MSGVLTLAVDAPELAQDVARRMQALVGETAEFAVVVDPAILGGFVAEVNGTVYDASVKGRLAELGEFLAKA